ncbi:Signal peptidase I [Alkalibacterium sp. AK22]|nr:Signal peptidase I [Alkalibacterium sp. AK22]
MSPTLEHQDRLLLNKISEVDRFDIVVFPAPEDPSKQYIKRVIGLPGDSIAYRDQVLYIDGEAVDESYIDLSQESDETLEFYNGDFSLPSLAGVDFVPEGMYFVLGDNRTNSRDSRSFGFVESESVIGETSLRIWPINRIGALD